MKVGLELLNRNDKMRAIISKYGISDKAVRIMTFSAGKINDKDIDVSIVKNQYFLNRKQTNQYFLNKKQTNQYFLKTNKSIFYQQETNK